MFIYTLDDSLTECISRAYMQTNPTDGLAIIYRPVPCATTISVKCVTVEATAKASFDFSLVTINLWFMPLRVEYAQPARYRSLPNHAWDRPVAKIGLVATAMCIGLFTFARYPDDANRRIPRRMPKGPSKSPDRFLRFVVVRLSSSL